MWGSLWGCVVGSARVRRNHLVGLVARNKDTRTGKCMGTMGAILARQI
jgi:hypothetical protein